MKLLNVDTLKIDEFFDDDVPEYAALSHTWGCDEASFQQWIHHPNPRDSKKRGFVKVVSACQLTQREGSQYLWVDTVCIDKTSSEHMTEAINSMFQWYRGAKICYAFLEDVEYQPGTSIFDRLRSSRWFTRGWTLQELIAPAAVVFYDRAWTIIGTKAKLSKELSGITSISEKVLHDSREVTRQSIAQRMSWLSKRKTTRKEDMAYCMIGIFDVNMHTMYGEGKKAFIRLQEEIVNNINDHTIFCWTWPDDTPRPKWMPLLAPNPTAFRHSGAYVLDRKRHWENMDGYRVINNLAIQIRLRIMASSAERCFALLDVRRSDETSEHVVAMPLARLALHSYSFKRPEPVWRADYPAGPVLLPPSWGSDPWDLSLARPGLEPFPGDSPGDSDHGGSFSPIRNWPKQKASPFAAMVMQRVDPDCGETLACLTRTGQSCDPLLFLKPTRSPRVWYQSIEVNTRTGAYLVYIAVFHRLGGELWLAGLDRIEPDAPVTVIERQVASWGTKVQFKVSGQGLDGVVCLEFPEDNLGIVQEKSDPVEGLAVRPVSFSVSSARPRGLLE